MSVRDDYNDIVSQPRYSDRLATNSLTQRVIALVAELKAVGIWLDSAEVVSMSPIITRAENNNSTEEDVDNLRKLLEVVEQRQRRPGAERVEREIRAQPVGRP